MDLLATTKDGSAFAVNVTGDTTVNLEGNLLAKVVASGDGTAYSLMTDKGTLGSSSKALSNFAPRELLSITQAKFLCKRLFRVLLKSFLWLYRVKMSPCLVMLLFKMRDLFLLDRMQAVRSI